jgi:hypothetical protein
MPLTRDKIIGFDPKSMVYRFLMMDGNQPIDCSVSNAVFNYLEKSRYPSDNVDALFLRWRETIEKAISDKFDAGESPDRISVHLFLEDLKEAVRPGVGIVAWNRVELMKSSISCHQYDSMSAIGNLWNLSVVGPFIAGSVQMTKLTWSQCLQEILTTLWA